MFHLSSVTCPPQSFFLQHEWQLMETCFDTSASESHIQTNSGPNLTQHTGRVLLFTSCSFQLRASPVCPAVKDAKLFEDEEETRGTDYLHRCCIHWPGVWSVCLNSLWVFALCVNTWSGLWSSLTRLSTRKLLCSLPDLLEESWGTSTPWSCLKVGNTHTYTHMHAAHCIWHSFSHRCSITSCLLAFSLIETSSLN